MKNIVVISICLLLLQGLTSCNTATKTETREVSGFSAISFKAFGELIIEQADEESLVVEGPINYLRYLTTEVEDGTLYLETRRGFVGTPTSRVTFRLKVKDLDDISFSGAGMIKIYAFTTDTIAVTLDGAGTIEMDNLQANSLDLLLNAAGAIVIAGEVDEQNVVLNGVGSYEGGDLASRKASVLLSGAGSAVVWATDTLDVTIAGLGSVSYFGSPQVTQNISGLGTVNSKGERR